MEDVISTDNIDVVIAQAPAEEEKVIAETPPEPKAPKKRAKKTATKVEIKVEEVQPEPVVVPEPAVVPQPIVEVKEIKPKAKRASRAAKKSEEVMEAEVVTYAPPVPQEAERTPFSNPIEITPAMHEELVRNWIQVQNNNKKLQKQQKYKSMLAQAV